MSEPIKPALTAEEWKHSSRETTLSAIGYLTDVSTRPREDRIHAIAALALYGQPFGFTREDVSRLREVAGEGYDGENIDYYIGKGTEAWVNALADRIEALLPREKL